MKINWELIGQHLFNLFEEFFTLLGRSMGFIAGCFWRGFSEMMDRFWE